MQKKSVYNPTADSITVDTIGLQMLLNSGRKTAVEIGEAAGAKICMGRRVLWDTQKIKEYVRAVSK